MLATVISLPNDAVVNDAFDWTLWLLASPVVLIVVVGAVLSLVRGKKKASATVTPER